MQQRANALSIGTDAYIAAHSRQIAFFALRHGLPTMGTSREHASAGLLISYGTNQVDSFQQAGVYVGRILKGDKPSNLSVMQSTKLQLLINLTTAKALGSRFRKSSCCALTK